MRGDLFRCAVAYANDVQTALLCDVAAAVGRVVGLGCHHHILSRHQIGNRAPNGEDIAFLVGIWFGSDNLCGLYLVGLILHLQTDQDLWLIHTVMQVSLKKCK